MSVIDEYTENLNDLEQAVVKRMNAVVRRTIPVTTEERYYAMPAFKYKGKGLVSILANKNFLSLYPYCAIDSLGIDFSAFEYTSGSIHFTLAKPIPDALLTQIVTARAKQIDRL